MADVIELWGAGTPRTLRPIWVAEELGLHYELHPIGPRTGETTTREFTAINPRQKIPAMVCGDFRLAESLAICRWLLDTHDGGGLWRPSNARERALEDQWCCYVFGEVDETALYVMRRHGDLASIYGAAPAAVQSSAEYAARHLGVLAAHLAQHDWLAGDGFGLADLFTMTCLDWARAYGVDLPERLAGYRDRIAGRAAWRAAVAANYPKEA